MRFSPAAASLWAGPAQRLICTTPWHATAAAWQRAAVLAEWFQARLVPRRQRNIEALFATEGADALVVADEPPRLYHRLAPTQPLFFHPGLACQRLRVLRRGGVDRLLQAARIRSGDVVVDATLGAGVDALVLAYGVGRSGQVWALESSWVLARVFQYAQRCHGHGYRDIAELLPRIQVHIGDHTAWLAALPDDSVDVVFFDPMFRQPLHAPANRVEAVRAWASPAALSTEAWQQAQRVARRCVVFKERPRSGEFARFALQPDKPHAKVALGVWWKEGAAACNRPAPAGL
ncbi:MAG: class I SAM-dependent methyltransferase [Alicyclobacillus sp.]|nr:class I SAM-dependent methyltransferase [Alicyclobacillus sp.]